MNRLPARLVYRMTQLDLWCFFVMGGLWGGCLGVGVAAEPVVGLAASILSFMPLAFVCRRIGREIDRLAEDVPPAEEKTASELA